MRKLPYSGFSYIGEQLLTVGAHGGIAGNLAITVGTRVAQEATWRPRQLTEEPRKLGDKKLETPLVLSPVGS